MKLSLQIPPDFREVAPKLRSVEAARRWNACMPVVRAWYRKCGIKPARLAVKGMAKSRGDSHDAPEQVEMCLNCKRARCSGSCDDVRLAAWRKP